MGNDHMGPPTPLPREQTDARLFTRTVAVSVSMSVTVKI